MTRLALVKCQADQPAGARLSFAHAGLVAGFDLTWTDDPQRPSIAPRAV
jgi:hypothetical protein